MAALSRTISELVLGSAMRAGPSMTGDVSTSESLSSVAAGSSSGHSGLRSPDKASKRGTRFLVLLFVVDVGAVLPVLLIPVKRLNSVITPGKLILLEPTEICL